MEWARLLCKIEVMNDSKKGLVILGSTGSVGTQTLDVVRTFPDSFQVVGLACNRNVELLGRQIQEFRPRYIHCNGADQDKSRLLPDDVIECDLEEMVCRDEVDIVVTATTGNVAIAPTLAAISARKQIALANKETIVMAGDMVTSLARSEGVDLMPLDSEPNAIWQCIRGERATVSRIIITASGGAFRNTPLDELSSVTPQQALKHPTWDMGRKITVDSATLMNKAFEVIEAHWLFGMPWEDIEVVIHPQSVIHSMVEFADGSIKAQLSKPDMRLPIQYALLYPDRLENPAIERFDPIETGSLTFMEWERERYPCFDMAIGFAKRGGTWPAALSGANDAAVQAFLDGHIAFPEIEQVIRAALDNHINVENPELSDIIYAGKAGYDIVSDLVRG